MSLQYVVDVLLISQGVLLVSLQYFVFLTNLLALGEWEAANTMSVGGGRGSEG